MKKYILVILSLILSLTLCVPVIAEELSADTSADSSSATDTTGENDGIDVDTGEMVSQIEGSGDTILKNIDEIEQVVPDTLEGVAGVSAFFGHTIGAAIKAFPMSFTVYVILLALIIVAVDIIKLLIK